MRSLATLGLLVVALGVPAVQAQGTPPFAPPTKSAPAAAPAANPVDPATIQALKDMGAHLQTLRRFSVSTEVTGERVLADGQKLQHSARADLDVARPNKLRAMMTSPRSQRTLHFNGSTVWLASPAQKAYSSVAFSGTLVDMANQLEERFGIEIPLADLFRFGTPQAPLGNIESAMNAGQDFIGKDLCDHYAIRQGALDWQIWITSGKQPLPRKIVITNRTDEARPQSASVITWNLKPTFNDAIFTYTPRAGSTKAEVIPVKTN